MITFACPRCRAHQTAEDRHAGLKKSCTNCGQRLLIPAPPSSPSLDQTMAGDLIELASLMKAQRDQARTGTRYYYTHNGSQFGPVSSKELRQLASTGNIVPTDIVFREGRNERVAASAVKGLFTELGEKEGELAPIKLTKLAKTDASEAFARELPPMIAETPAWLVDGHPGHDQQSNVPRAPSPSTAIPKYWVKIKGLTEGPFTRDQVRQQIAAGTVALDCMAAKVGSPTWQPLSQFPEMENEAGLSSGPSRATPSQANHASLQFQPGPADFIEQLKRVANTLRAKAWFAPASVAAGATFLILIIVLSRPAGSPAPTDERTSSNRETLGPANPDQIYERLLKSTVWIVTPDERGLAVGGIGSGSLVDDRRKLVITNYHVVTTRPKVLVFFPDYRNNEPIGDPKHYAEEARRLGIVGHVVARDASLDLALVQLESLPATSRPLSLSSKSARPGQAVHSIGASGVDLNSREGGVLWRYTSGQVRQVYQRSMTFENGQHVSAVVVETQSPINPGDSGGPVVNDEGLLIAVASSADPQRRLISNNIDVREVQLMLSRYTGAR